MNDERRTIGTDGAAGRGSRGSSPSAGARALAPPSRRRAGDGETAKKQGASHEASAKKSSTTPAAKKTTPKKTTAKKSAANKTTAKKTTANKATPTKSAAPQQDATTTATKKTAGTTKAGSKKPSATKASSPKKAADATRTAGAGARAHEEPEATSTSRRGPRRLRAVTDEDAARAAAAAAEDAARETRTAGPATMPGIPLEEIVSALIGAAQRVLGSDWDRRLAVAMSALRKRLAGEFTVDEFGFDADLTEVLVGALEPLAEKWFRLEVRGAENIPDDGGALLVANHSGTVPLDGVMTMYAVQRHTGRHLRPLGADLVFSLPFVGQVARRTGTTLACAEDAERLLAGGELAGVWPEGFKGIGKPFAERYKLQRFGRGGFVSSALRAQVPIVPLSIVGAEEIYPLIGNVPSLARLLGLPYLPVTPFFPLLGPLGMIPLPSKWIIEFGEPIRTDAYEPDAADDPMLLFNVTDQVRETIQQTLYELLVDRGSAFF